MVKAFYVYCQQNIKTESYHLNLYKNPYLAQSTSLTITEVDLSHNNPCLLCNITITNFLVLHTCEVRFHDVIDHTVPMVTL